MIFSKSRPVKIVLVGTGGTGGYIVPQLYRLLYALDRPIRVILCDGDLVEEKNLGRQNFIEADLGKNKAMVLAERYQKSTLSDLYRLLETYTLDPVFERYGEFVNRTPCWIDGETARKYSGASVIAGNFLSYSHAFYLITDQEELIRSLERLIEKNRASPQYQAARARWLSSDDRPQPDRQ